jgi:hypothetical protein
MLIVLAILAPRFTRRGPRARRARWRGIAACGDRHGRLGSRHRVRRSQTRSTRRQQCRSRRRRPVRSRRGARAPGPGPPSRRLAVQSPPEHRRSGDERPLRRRSQSPASRRPRSGFASSTSGSSTRGRARGADPRHLRVHPQGDRRLARARARIERHRVGLEDRDGPGELHSRPDKGVGVGGARRPQIAASRPPPQGDAEAG